MNGDGDVWCLVWVDEIEHGAVEVASIRECVEIADLLISLDICM